MILRFFLFSSFLVAFNHLQAQILTGINTKWNDSFTEWTFKTLEEEEGDLVMKWPFRKDWTEWDYRIGEETGTIRMKWKDNPNLWEIVGLDETITARAIWKGDFTQWRLQGNADQITLKCRWKNNLNEWRVIEKEFGKFEIFTEWEDDPRDWIIVDETENKITLTMKMALSFLAIFHSTPKI